MSSAGAHKPDALPELRRKAQQFHQESARNGSNPASVGARDPGDGSYPRGPKFNAIPGIGFRDRRAITFTPVSPWQQAPGCRDEAQ